MMNNTAKVYAKQIIAAYGGDRNRIFETFSTIEEAKEKESYFAEEGGKVGHVWILETEDGENLDDADGCYETKDAAIKHLHGIRFSHSSEATDTEGHSYCCNHCGIHFYVFDEEEIPACTIEKVFQKTFEVAYSLKGSITIAADSEEEAREFALSSDHVETSELIEGVKRNIADAGNDAIEIDDVYENKEI